MDITACLTKFNLLFKTNWIAKNQDGKGIIAVSNTYAEELLNKDVFKDISIDFTLCYGKRPLEVIFLSPSILKGSNTYI